MEKLIVVVTGIVSLIGIFLLMVEFGISEYQILVTSKDILLKICSVILVLVGIIMFLAIVRDTIQTIKNKIS